MERASTRERILQFIRGFLEERGYPPTIRDIARGCGIRSHSLVQYHLEALQREGYIQRDPGVFRSIQLLREEGTIRVPLLGSIAAGEPIPVPRSEGWAEVPEDWLELPRELVGRREGIFALR
ncbi:MAG: repressor LexA, partial [Chloroflexi bacterium]